MQSELLNVLLDCAAAALPKNIQAPAAGTNMCYFGPPKVRGAVLQKDTLPDRIADIANRPNLSEGDMVQVLELAKNFFDSLEKEEIADVETMERVQQQISYVTGLLSNASYIMAQRYKTERESQQKEKLRLMGEKDLIFSNLESDKKKQKEYLDRYSAMEQKLKQLEMDVDADMQEIIQARKDLDDIRAKEEELKKWCWVPFYNIYLYVDSEKAASRYNACCERLYTAQRQREALLREQEELHSEMVLTQRMEAETRVRLISNEQAMKRCIEAINQAKSKVLQYSDFTVFFGKMNARLENQDADKQLLINILAEIKVMFGKMSAIQ